ncbi:ribonuclease H-like domain-containing protein [Mariannaea sp. PMI_226]|nr:ribonuclease H-like domain-containing protein [Mariannaea sp. PMI_226]
METTFDSPPAPTELPAQVSDALISAPPRVIKAVGALITQTPEYLEALNEHIILPGDLKARGYPLGQLSKADLVKKIRCKRCSRALSKTQTTREPRRFSANTNLSVGDDLVKVTENLSLEQDKQPDEAATEEIRMNCKFHSGRVFRGTWSCCKEHIHSPPCQEEQGHLPRSYAKGELAAYWRMYKTPPSRPDSQIRTAVVLDCEMGVAESGESELIRLSMVDYFTCEILIDKLIWPDVKMSHYNTRFSGVTRAMMERARKSRQCIFGNKKARLEVWNYVGPKTIIIGHSAQGDLKSLRLIHQTVVDTLEVERYMSGRGSGLSLKKLAKERLDREIQIKRKGHDSLEDAIATRDVLHWHISLAVEPKQASNK